MSADTDARLDELEDLLDFGELAEPTWPQTRVYVEARIRLIKEVIDG